MSFWGNIQVREFTVDLHEMAESPVEEMRDGRVKVTRVYHCPWSDRKTAVTELLGGVVGTQYGFGIFRPHRDPDYPWLYALGCRVAPFGAVTSPEGSTYCTYGMAQITAEYEQPEYDVEGESAYVSERIEGAAEFLTIPSTGLSWDAGGTIRLDADEVPGFLRKMLTWSLTYHRMPYVPSDIWSYFGAVNQQGIMTEKYGLTFQPGEVLFGAPTVEEQNCGEDVRLYDLSFNLTFKPGGWNKLLRYIEYDENKYAFVPAVVYQAGNPWTPYKTLDFSGILPSWMTVA